MAIKVSTGVSFPRLSDPNGVMQWAGDAMTQIARELMAHAQRLNKALLEDGSEAMEQPLLLPSYTVAGLPAAGSWQGAIVYVSNGTANKRLAVSDGTNWRFPDGNIVS